MDPQCQDFNEYIGDLPMHFEKWAPHKKFVSAHVAKRYPVNWKVAQEAFMEAFHVIATHPQILTGTGDCNSQYDVFGNFSRAITPNGTPSPHLQWDPTEQEIFDAITDKRLDEEPMATIPEGMTARAFAAQVARERLRSAVPTLIPIVMLKLMTACTSLYSRTSIHGALSIGSITDSVQLVQKLTSV